MGGLRKSPDEGTPLKRITLLAVASVLALSACTSTPEVEAIPSETPSVSAESTQEPTPEPVVEEAGSRIKPLAVGEQRRLSEDSAFTVGVPAKPEATDQYVSVPVRVEVDWAAIEEQGLDGSNEGIDPFLGSLFFEMVLPDGTTIDQGELSADFNAWDAWFQKHEKDDATSIGSIFPPKDVTEGHLPFPTTDLKGATLRVSNMENSSVFIALG
jgi:hypothetical protein